jgi:hypothetical protein
MDRAEFSNCHGMFQQWIWGPCSLDQTWHSNLWIECDLNLFGWRVLPALEPSGRLDTRAGKLLQYVLRGTNSTFQEDVAYASVSWICLLLPGVICEPNVECKSLLWTKPHYPNFIHLWIPKYTWHIRSNPNLYF